MPYKRADGRSPYYYARCRNLPAYGDTGRLSTRSTTKAVARRMEQLLRDIAQWALLDPSWYRLLDAVCRDKTVSLPELLRAKNTGTLEALRRSLHDPLLLRAIEDFETAERATMGIRSGLGHLRRLAPAGSRLSYLSDGRTITDLCRRLEKEGQGRGTGKAGMKRNSVRRTLLQAMSRLLRHHLGQAERDRIFAAVHFSPVDDTREVHLTPIDIARLLKACDQLASASDRSGALYYELGVVVRMALQTSADRGVLLAGKQGSRTYRGLLVRDLKMWVDAGGTYNGVVHLYDTKTEDRSRTVPLTDSLCRALLPLCKMKAPDEPVFSIAYKSLHRPWDDVRRAAGLEHVRFKDLRAQISQYGEEAGVPLTVLSRTMGHGEESMTRRYQRRQAVLSGDLAAAIEAAMYDVRSHEERGDRPAPKQRRAG